MRQNKDTSVNRADFGKVLSRLSSLLFLFLAAALATNNAFAHTLIIGKSGFQFTDNSSKDDKKSDKKKAERKKKEKLDEDEDKDDDDDDKESVKSSKESKKSDKKEKSKNSNNPPTVSISIDAIEVVHALIETDPVPSSGDAADDPAIWINKTDPGKSTIIGTDKQSGLAVYDLSGKQIQYLADGRMDNVDLRDNFKLGGDTVSLVTAGNRSDNSIAIYKVNPESRLLENVAAQKISHKVSVYGSCMYRSPKNGSVFYFATSKSGDVEQWELFDNGAGKVDSKLVRSFKVGSVVEGCVADDEMGHFYVAEEAVGIWKYGADPDAGNERTLVGKVGDGNLFADVEGLTIAYYGDGKGYLIASSQGNNSFVVYRREGNNEYVKKFRIVTGSSVDGAEDTDGIDVTTANLGPNFSQGLFVVQDGINEGGKQNFKLVPFEAIIKP